jgi:hypothetical protein
MKIVGPLLAAAEVIKHRVPFPPQCLGLRVSKYLIGHERRPFRAVQRLVDQLFIARLLFSTTDSHEQVIIHLH